MSNVQSYDLLIYSDAQNKLFAESLCVKLSDLSVHCCRRTTDDPFEKCRACAESAEGLVLVMGKTSAFNQNIERMLNICYYSNKSMTIVKMPGFVNTPRLEGYMASARVFEAVCDAETIAGEIVRGMQEKAEEIKERPTVSNLGNFTKIISNVTNVYSQSGSQTKTHMTLKDAESVYNQAVYQLNTDKASAMNRLLECARTGHVPSMLVIASEYEKKKSNPQALAKAKQFYRAAANTDPSEGSYQYGMFCARQDDLHEAEQYMLKAVQQSEHVGAARMLAEWYGENGPLENRDRACFFQNLLIKCGDTKAMVARARSLMRGDKADQEKALQILEKASRTDPEASIEIADYYIARRNEAEAASYLLDAAQRNNARAQYMLGVWYAEGKGICEKNLSEAARWLGRASGSIPEALEILSQPRFKGFR